VNNINKRRFFLFAAPILALAIILGADLQPGNPAATATSAVALWMAIWWISESVPLAITALLPIALFPLLGVMNGKAVSGVYVNHIIFLFIGGMMVAFAMQDWGLHKRIALRVLSLFGKGPGTVLFGFMASTAFLSMWISNTAATMMMVPVAVPIIASLSEQLRGDRSDKIATGFLLAIAYSASIGGIASLIGSPPNLSFTRILAISFPQAPEISFANWMFFALPISLLMFAACWLLLYGMYVRRANHIQLDRSYFKEQYQALGRATREQKIISIAFSSMALLWMFRSNINLGFISIPGWSNIFANPKFFNDGTVAVAVALCLFIIPSSKGGKPLLDEQVFAKMPWHLILLFGGGFALASGFVESGLSVYLAEQLKGLSGIPPLLVIACICLLITFLTELSSNTATTEMFLPILAAMAVALEVNPLLLMIPATLSASCAFMLPVATPPNAIIFSTNQINVYQMAKTGITLNLVGVMIITIASYYLIPLVFDFTLTELPAWATMVGAHH